MLADHPCIGFRHHHGAAGLADELVRPLDHAVALAGLSDLHLAGSGQFEALLRARIGLHLGHLLISSWPERKTCAGEGYAA